MSWSRGAFVLLVFLVAGRLAAAQGTTPLLPAAAGAPPAATAPKPEQAKRAVSLPVREAQQETEQKESAARSAERTAEDAADQMARLRTEIDSARDELVAARRKAKQLETEVDTLQTAFQHRLDANAPQAELRQLQDKVDDARRAARAQQDEVRDQGERLDEMRTELLGLQSQEIEAAQKAGRERRAAEIAKWREWIVAVEQTLLWQGPKVVLIVLAMFLLKWLSRVVIVRVIHPVAGAGLGSLEERRNRAKTLTSVFENAATTAIVLGGGLTILNTLQIPIGPLLGGVAVAGLAVAFGAQNLIRDYFYGFVILLENQYVINDVLKVGDFIGQVERITLRMTVLRDTEGRVCFLPNGKLDAVTNMTHGWSKAAFEIPVAFSADADRVIELLLEMGNELRHDQQFVDSILSEPDMLGVDRFVEQGYIVKFTIKTRPLRQWPVRRELLRRIVKRFKAESITLVKMT